MSGFAAKYGGWCAECDERFAEGDLIRRTLDGWAHQQCPNVGFPPGPAREVCDRCWLEKSATGECGCEA